MFQEIQEIVDDLAEDLDRAVVVEDEHHALIAHSPHRRQVDAIRERSVFMRQTPAEMIEWVATQGLRESEGPLRLPANPALGAESRICVPLRADGVLIGILAVLDAAADAGARRRRALRGGGRGARAAAGGPAAAQPGGRRARARARRRAPVGERRRRGPRRAPR